MLKKKTNKQTNNALVVLGEPILDVIEEYLAAKLYVRVKV